ncbi:MAG: type II secretion system F family protein [Armatimonadetes bacterium]|nr:type II secretion system F family protein [Armatimonadota bacterium]
MRSHEPTGKVENDWRLHVSCSPEAVALFVRQLAEMFRAGIPLAQALETLAHQPDQPSLAAAVVSLAQDVHGGHTLSAALHRFPRLFPNVLVVMVRIGERSGGLEKALLQVAVWLERDNGIRKRMRAAMVYPSFVLFLTGLLTLGLFTSIMPGFVEILEGMHVELPLITRMVVALTHTALSPGAWLIGISVVGAFTVFARDYLRNPKGRRSFYRVLLKVPVFGPLTRCTAIARYSAAVHSLVATGVPLDKTIELAGEASGNPLFSEDSQNMVKAMHGGIQISEHMRARTDLYPPTFLHMTVLAEETSRVEDVYQRMARFYDQEIEYRIEVLGAMMEPLMMLVVGLVVGTVVFAVFLPLYSYLGRFGT